MTNIGFNMSPPEPPPPTGPAGQSQSTDQDPTIGNTHNGNGGGTAPPTLAALRHVPCWLVWHLDITVTLANGKHPKVPYYASQVKRSNTFLSPEDRAQLVTYEAAVAAINARPGFYTGVGIVSGFEVAPGWHIQGLDFDNMPADKVQSAPAQMVGYVEVTPSGAGLRAIGVGRKFATLPNQETDIEAYCNGQFLTITFNTCKDDGPTDLFDFVQDVLAPMHAKRKAAKTNTASASCGVETEQVDPKVMTELRSALFYMRADDYHTWQSMGSALRSLGEAGRGLWLEWSATSPKFNPGKAAEKWEKLGGERSNYKAVFKAAQDAGWLNPNSNEARGAAPSASMGGSAPDSKKGADLLSKLRNKSATNNLEELKMKAETEVLVFGEIGSLGQFISLHAFPNKGKTLITLYWVLQAIEKGIVEGENIFFLNFDDNANGFIDKTEIANELGFNMLGPNQTSVEELSEILAGLCDNNVASGTVFICDTLKKFVNVMNKEKQSEFYKLLRRYVMSGGTVLTLGHCNKNPDENGKPVVAGTQDISDDVDALYVIDVVEGANSTVVEIEKRKNRGMGVEVAYYTFGNVHGLESEDAAGKHINRYRALLNTVMPLANSTASVSKGMMDRQLSMQKYQHVIEAIRVAISAGMGQQMQIVEAVNTAHGYGKNLIRKVLSVHTWTSTDNYVAGAGFLWFCVKGPKNNSKNYTLTQG